MSSIRFSKSKLFGEVTSSPSKSEFIRALLASFLCFGEKTKINSRGNISKDVNDTIIALQKLGGSFCDGEFISPKNIKEKVSFSVGESGTLLRMLLPVLAALGGNYEIKIEGSLQNRPIDELVLLLRSNGATIKRVDNSLFLSGKLCHGKYEIRGDISSQYISGLLFALPILKNRSEIVLTTPLKSKGYVDMTLDVLKSFGIFATKTQSGFIVDGNQKYVSPKSVDVGGDYSSASYYLLCGAILGSVSVSGLNSNTFQSDEMFFEILQSAGVKMERNGDCITAKKSERLSPVVFDVDASPDLAPTVASLAAFCDGVSELINIERLRIKESDRVDGIIKMLSSVGIKSALRGNSLDIFGGKPKSGVIESFSDHRIAMAGSVILSRVGGELKNCECVEKSEPNFFDNIKKLGGIIE